MNLQRLRAALGSDTPSSVEDLPAPSTRRWVVKRKAQVVAGVHKGILSVDEAIDRYHLSEEEFDGWCKLFNQHGLRGLRTTRVQQYRK